MFFFKKKEIIVDAFTRNESIAQQYPLAKASSFIPEWWKQTPKSYTVDDLYEMPTVKTCPGILDLYKKGFMMPLWTDIAFNVNEDMYRWQSADMSSELSIHDHRQWDLFADKNKFGHLKIMSEWSIRTNKNINWMFAEPYWNKKLDAKYTISPGIINAYHTNMPLNVQMMIDKRSEYKFQLIAGEPIAHLIPLSENDIKIVTHVVDEKDWKKYTVINRSKFLNGYNNTIKKCPFHR